MLVAELFAVPTDLKLLCDTGTKLNVIPAGRALLEAVEGHKMGGERKPPRA